MRHTLPPSAVQGASPALPEAEAVLLLGALWSSHRFANGKSMVEPFVLWMVLPCRWRSGRSGLNGSTILFWPRLNVCPIPPRAGAGAVGGWCGRATGGMGLTFAAVWV